MRVLFASSNRGKLLELKVALEPYHIEILGPEEVLGAGQALPEVDEDSPDYEGNALKKARSAARHCAARGIKVSVLADDSGLEVDALGGAPGVLSARFGGVNASAADNRAALRSALSPKQVSAASVRFPARFVCLLVLIQSHGSEIIVRGLLEGAIHLEDRGSGGFGYDPMFEVGNTGKTLAELKQHGIEPQTHRTIAAALLVEKLGLASAAAV